MPIFTGFLILVDEDVRPTGLCSRDEMIAAGHSVYLNPHGLLVDTVALRVPGRCRPEFPESVGAKGVPPALAAWPGDCDCVFCNLIAATRFADRARHAGPIEAERAGQYCASGRALLYRCLNAFPYTSGHVMVVPYAHQETLASSRSGGGARDDEAWRKEPTRSLRQVYSSLTGSTWGLNLGQGGGGWRLRPTSICTCPPALAGRLRTS